MTLQDLNLNSNCISEIDEKIESLASLQVLDLGNNKITAVPFSFGNCSELITLKLSGNGITELPDNCKSGHLSLLTCISLVGKLSGLEVLELHDNAGLIGLPITCTSMRNLRILTIYGTKSDHFPFALEAWTHLEELIIKRNQIEEIPETIGNLRDLLTLDVQGILLYRVFANLPLRMCSYCFAYFYWRLD